MNNIKGTYIGLFFVALSTLMLEIVLTRLFSVATWYYFAFFAISIAMFGLTVGALIVYIFKDYFSQERLRERLTLASLVFAITTGIALLIFLAIPFDPKLTTSGIVSTAVIYLTISVPFVASGVVFCLCITRFTERIAFIYAADLIGAACGAFLVFPVLNSMDAPSAVFLVGAVGALGALFFASGNKAGSLYKVSVVVFLLLTVVMLVNSQYKPVKMKYVKGSLNEPQSEAWNTFSRIAVYPEKVVRKPYSWGLSSVYKQDRDIVERMIDIDGTSETVMTKFNGLLKGVEHLKYDVTSVAHYLKEDASIFVIGVGGGRDLLTAKVFKQKEVVGAEINDRILDMLNIEYGNFSGHITRLPGVTIINDEARSAITRMDKKFDIIQASCIATWSATTAGAFSLAENSLYTVEAWKIFFDHLKPDGVLAFNRWYSPDYPAQLLRLASLASYSLKLQGVKDPAKHIAVIRNSYDPIEVSPGRFRIDIPSATIIVSKIPFSDKDIARLREVSVNLNFPLEFDPGPGGHRNPLFDKIIENSGDSVFHDGTAMDLTAPTDDRPFFFYMLKLKDVGKGEAFFKKFQEQKFIVEGIVILFILLIISIVLCLVFIIAPLLYVRRKLPLPSGGGGAVALLFFASIGFGYILVELGQLQRLVLFLGHPIYSITVVLFAMLFSSGLGSMTSGLVLKGKRPGGKAIAICMLVILAMILFIALIQPQILLGAEKGGIVSRILVSLCFLFPLGFFMGLPFPLAMTLAKERYGEHTPWFWAINGSTGVVASILSVWISINWGFTVTLFVGFFCYLIAAITLLRFSSLTSSSR